MKYKCRLLLVVMAMLVAHSMGAQTVAVKTNLVSDAFANINAGVELGIAPKWTVDVKGDVNFWDITETMKWKHAAAQPAIRYWFCDRFLRGFIGIHAHGGIYNVGGIKNGLNLLGTDFSKLADSRYQGWFVGGGISGGYDWILGEHWNLEAELGLGYSYTRYDRFNCIGCGKKVEENIPHHYIGLTKLGINLVYLF